MPKSTVTAPSAEVYDWDNCPRPEANVLVFNRHTEKMYLTDRFKSKEKLYDLDGSRSMGHGLMVNLPTYWCILSERPAEPKQFSDAVHEWCERIDLPGYEYLVHDGAVPTFQLVFTERCTFTGESGPQFGRKWVLDESMTEDQFVATVFKAYVTCLEHEARETFKYKGKRVFGPHQKLSELVKISK